MKKNKIIMGSAMGIAAIAIAIDHTKHRLPAPQPAGQYIIMQEGEASSPCGMGESENPCGMGESETPCGMGNTPCGM